MIATSAKSSTLWAYLQMMRPANILTAWADIFLGTGINYPKPAHVNRTGENCRRKITNQGHVPSFWHPMKFHTTDRLIRGVMNIGSILT